MFIVEYMYYMFLIGFILENMVFKIFKVLNLNFFMILKIFKLFKWLNYFDIRDYVNNYCCNLNDK